MLSARNNLKKSKLILKEILEKQDDCLSDLKEELEHRIRWQTLKKRILWSAIFVSLFSAIFIVYHVFCLGLWGKEIYVFTEKAIICDSPNINNFKFVDKVEHGQKLVAKWAISSRKIHPLIKVDIPDKNKSGYISAMYVAYKNGNLIFEKAIVKELCDVKAKPDKRAKAVGSLMQEARINILSLHLDSGGKLWYHVISNGIKGFIRGNDVRLVTSWAAESSWNFLYSLRKYLKMPKTK